MSDYLPLHLDTN